MTNKQLTLTLITVGIIAIAMGIGGAVLVRHLQTPPPTNVQENIEIETDKQKAEAAWQAALSAMNEGNKAEAQAQLDIAEEYYRKLNDEAGIENVASQRGVVDAIPDPDEAPPLIEN